jgi:hypothetical protein
MLKTFKRFKNRCKKRSYDAMMTFSVVTIVYLVLLSMMIGTGSNKNEENERS